MLKTTLMDFQRDGVSRIEQWNGRCLLGDDMGLGKTIQALAAMDRNPDWLPAVIVTPAHLKLSWQRQAKQHVGWDIPVLSGMTPDWGQVKGQRAVIVNYDILPGWLYQLMALKPKLVIADECHALQSEDSQRTKGVRTLMQGVPHFLPISGTPINNRPIEFFPVLNMLCPQKFPSRYAFGHRYCRPKRNPYSGGWDFKGASNTAELHGILTDPLFGLMIRRLKRDVLKDLPAKMHNTVPLRLTKTQMREYKDARDDVRGWLKANYRPGTGKGASQAEALQRVNVLRQLTCALKLPHVIEWVKGFLESGEKLIVFGSHRDKFVCRLHQAFRKQAVVVHGGVTGRARQEAFDRFNEDGKVRLFVGNWVAGGTGWSATACSNVAAGEYPWQPPAVTQGIDRVDGIGRGQKGQGTSAWMLVADGTYEPTQLEALQEKERAVYSVLDGKDWTDKQDAVFDAVCAEIMK